MNKLKYSKPVLKGYACYLEGGVTVSSATFTTGGAGATPQIEDWVNELPQEDNWEFSIPED